MKQPVVLDLFCGGGGAGLGYARAGFRVIGVDVEDHEHGYLHAGEFHRMDWRVGLEKFVDVADFIHSSPPCQLYSNLTRWGREKNLLKHPDLVSPVREALQRSGKPFLIENVEGAPLVNPIMLCGWTFNKEQYRHRIFEAGGGLSLIAPKHRKHNVRASSPGHFIQGTFISVGGNFSPVALGREVMDMPFHNRSEVAEAIPPYFTEYLGYQVRMHLLLTQYRPGPEAHRLVWGN